MKTKWTPQELYNNITEHLESLNPEKTYICYIEEKESKESKTRQQEKTYYKILTAISKHLWYDMQEVKIYLLSGCFWTHKLKLSKTEIEVPNISQTSMLTKEQWIFFIDTILTFAKLKNVPIEITSAEMQNLFDSYN